MNNFLDFILKDIEAKKTLDFTAPTKTKTNQRKLYETIDSIQNKYREYQTNILNYMVAKAKALDLKEEKDRNIEILNDKIEELRGVAALLNPTNTYLEKMGFSLLLYQINNYYAFNFSSLNTIINGFLDKFSEAGITLRGDDFRLTCYVHEYMSSYLEVYYKKSDNYNKVNDVFEKIYFLNPEIISHIELNFRKLIQFNKGKFVAYINKLQKEVLIKNGLKDYKDCIEKLREAYLELSVLSQENVSLIMMKAKNGSIDMEQYAEDNKVRKAAFDSVISDNVDINDNAKMEDICDALEKLNGNISEYSNYLEFLPLVEDFKAEYSKELEDSKKGEYKGFREIKELILKKEDELLRINKKLMGGKPGFFEPKIMTDPKTLKIESVCKAKEIYELYKIYDQEYFKDKVLRILSKTLSVADLLNLYYSFDYFKMLAIKKVYNLNTYKEIEEYSKRFDLFAANPCNVVTSGVLVFDDANIGRVIANKYRLNNIKITEEDLDKNNLVNLKNKIDLILRVNKINNSNTSVDKIWFCAMVKKIVDKDKDKQ